MATPHDAAWKLLFSFPDMVRDLLAGFVLPECVGALDLATLEPGSATFVSDTLRERFEDRVWRACRHDRRLDLMVCLEFQSTVDRTMAVRVLDYSALLYQELLRNRERRQAAQTKSGGKDCKGRRGRVKPEPLPPVLPIVLYHGRKRWRAKEDVAGLCTPSGERLAPYQPSQRHFVLDVGHHIGPLPQGRNLMAALIRLAHCRDTQAVASVLGALVKELAPSQTGLLAAFLVWYEQARKRHDLPKVDLPILDDLNEGKTMPNEVMREQVARWAEQQLAPQLERSRADGRAEGRSEGRTQGRTEGRVEVVRRLAARKFGAETAERLAERLAEIADPERAVEVGEWLLECESGEDLLDRVERLCESTANGNGAAPG